MSPGDASLCWGHLGKRGVGRGHLGREGESGALALTLTLAPRAAVARGCPLGSLPLCPLLCVLAGDFVTVTHLNRDRDIRHGRQVVRKVRVCSVPAPSQNGWVREARRAGGGAWGVPAAREGGRAWPLGGGEDSGVQGPPRGSGHLGSRCALASLGAAAAGSCCSNTHREEDTAACASPSSSLEPVGGRQLDGSKLPARSSPSGGRVLKNIYFY